MKTSLTQDRISISNVRISAFASKQSLCFSSTVLFDGAAIADAHNAGRGGMTRLQAREGQSQALREAKIYAQTLSFKQYPRDGSENDANKISIKVTLDYLIEQLVESLHVERKLRSTFNQEICNKVMYVKEGKLLYLKGVKLKAIANQTSYFATLRTSQGQKIIILAELPVDEAYALWKLHILGGAPINSPHN